MPTSARLMYLSVYDKRVHVTTSSGWTYFRSHLRGMGPVTGYCCFPGSGDNDRQLEPAVYHQLRPQRSDTTTTREGSVSRSVYTRFGSEQIHGMGTRRYALSVDNDNEFRSRVTEYHLDTSGLKPMFCTFVHVCDGKSKCYHHCCYRFATKNVENRDKSSRHDWKWLIENRMIENRDMICHGHLRWQEIQ